ncbi:hypothetical protein MSS2_00593 [Mycobacterium marinum]|nr:hypothetical protein MSS2_00593 [Mycobacterium marinum]
MNDRNYANYNNFRRITATDPVQIRVSARNLNNHNHFAQTEACPHS